MTRVMFIGLACFDVVSVCEKWPAEDTDTQVQKQELRRGGNASNSSTCFVSLTQWLRRRSPDAACDTPVEFFGTLGGDVAAEFLEKDMKSVGIIIEHVVKYEETGSAMATVIINKSNGSRTIFYCHKNVPEVTAGDFMARIDLSDYSWIHMEARKNCPELVNIIRHVRHSSPASSSGRRITLSVEVEKPSKSRDAFFGEDVDYFFISKDYARWKGAEGISRALEVVLPLIPTDRTTVIICAWAEAGARAAVVEFGEMRRQFSSPAFTPSAGLVDTTGAGDSFIAGTVFALQVMRLELGQALEFGCRFAGAKCGTLGNRGLDNFEQFL